MLDDSVIRHMCREVGRASALAGWTFKCMPVVVWEFPTIGDFARAKVELMRAVTPLMTHMRVDAGWARATAPHEFEIDCNGVTFRLVCRQQIATPMGNVGAAQVNAVVVVLGKLPWKD